MEVCVTLQEIFELYDIPYYEDDFLDEIDLNTFQNIDMNDIVKYLNDGRGTWNHQPDIELLTNFNQAIMFSVIKMWMQFFSTRITPSMNVSNMNTFRAIFLYGISQKKKKKEMYRQMDPS